VVEHLPSRCRSKPKLPYYPSNNRAAGLAVLEVHTAQHGARAYVSSPELEKKKGQSPCACTYTPKRFVFFEMGFGYAAHTGLELVTHFLRGT
jgi:hypothetical protein